jgi:hypothetical protein
MMGWQIRREKKIGKQKKKSPTAKTRPNNKKKEKWSFTDGE